MICFVFSKHIFELISCCCAFKATANTVKSLFIYLVTLIIFKRLPQKYFIYPYMT